MDAMHSLAIGDVLRGHRRTFRPKNAQVCGSDRYSFEQTDDRVNRLANALAEAGVDQGSRVLWLGRNCHRVFELLLACAKLGAMVCPVNWRMSAQEQAFVIDDLDPEVVVWESRTIHNVAKEALALAGYSGVSLQSHGDSPDGYEAFMASASDKDPDRDVDPALPVLVLYTAAFQGRPNGSMLTHMGLLMQSLVLQRLQDIGSDYVYLNCGPLFHIATFQFTLATFHAGGTNVFTPKAEAEELCRVIESERCAGGFVMAPTIMQILEVNKDRRFDLSSFRSFIPIPGWTEMTSPDPSPWGRRPGGYGQTEVTGLCAYSAFGAPEGMSTAGRPAPVTRILIVDDIGNEVPDGEVGEIVVRGPLVHAGYWNRPEINDERFQTGWWRTNDLGRRSTDGAICFVGPKTRMIKSGVENIYPAEVEACLESHQAVKEAAIIGVPHERWIQTVKAIVVLRDGATATQEEIIEYCKQNIASYKKPTRVEFLGEPLPRREGVKDYDALDGRFGGGNYPGGGTKSS